MAYLSLIDHFIDFLDSSILRKFQLYCILAQSQYRVLNEFNTNQVYYRNQLEIEITSEYSNRFVENTKSSSILEESSEIGSVEAEDPGSNPIRRFRNLLGILIL